MRLGAGFACWLMLLAGLVEGQEPARAPEPPRLLVPDKPPAQRAAPGRSIEQAEPPLYYLKDKQGQLQAVPGFSFENFVELYKLKNQLNEPEARPAFTLEQLTLTGTVAGERAELSVELKVRTQEARWVRVPLRLDQAMLSQPAEYEGKGKHFVHYQPGGEGYVVWIEGQPDQEHQLTLKILVPLLELGGAKRLKLFLPRAASSQVQLTVPIAGAAAKVSEGTLRTSASPEQDGTVLTVLGPGGDFELSWRAADAKSSEPAAALEVVGAILTRIDGRSVDTEATLTVRSYGEPFDRFRVNLPRDAELVPRPASSYTLSPLPPPKGSAERIVEVHLPRPTAGPVDVQLAARRLYDATKTDQWLELSGFEVAEASRQWGHLAVAVVGDWHVLWGPSRGMQRVDQWPESLRYEDVVAGFEYFAQPASLAARLGPRKTHVGVEPEYLLLVDPDQVKLEAKLRYTVRGAKAFKLDVRLGDWQFDAVEPDYLVQADAVSATAKMLTIPLQQPSTGQVELVLRAHQPIPAGATKLTVSLPQPQANSLGPAALVVLSADNLELVPDSEAMAGLTRQQVRPSTPLPERQQAPLFYRGEVSKAVFAAALLVHPRSVGVEIASQVTLDAKSLQVEQKFSYTIAHEPLDRLLLDVPRVLGGPEKLACQLQGQPLAPVVLPDGQEDSKPLRMAVALSKSYLGACELTVKYAVDARPPGPGGGPLRVPLVMPGEGNLQANKLSITAPPEMSVQAADATWTPVVEESQRSRLVLSASGRVQEAPLSISLQASSSAPGTCVERLWIQTWLSQSERQDRALFRITTDRKDLPLAIPEGAAQGQALVLVDGKQVTPQVASSGGMTAPLPGDSRSHTVELRYFFPAGRPPRGPLSLEAPRIAGGVWSRRVYWQLVLPPNEHILATPPSFTREYVWGWDGYFWGRKPLLEQPELEAWSGATHQTPVPEGTNRYLFSTMGKIDGCELRTAPRSSIVLFASGIALVAGLLLIHVPAARHPTSLLAVAVGLFAAGMLYPEPMLLISQSAGLGLALAIIAGLLQKAFSRRRRIHRHGTSVLEKGSTVIYRSSAAIAAPASTQSIPPPPATLEWDV